MDTNHSEISQLIALLPNQVEPSGDDPATETRLLPVVAPDRRIALLDNRSLLISELPEFFGSLAQRKWTLLYRASIHGWRSFDFHDHCDGKSETVTLVESLGENGLENRVFGGYTPVAWDSSKGYKAEPDGRPKGFIFALNPPSGPPRRHELIGSARGNAIYSNPDYGPTFGNAHDIYICDVCNVRRDSYTRCGSSYASNGSDGQKFFHTIEKFGVKELEVFQLTE
jgi:hypothetical protein